MPIGVYGLQESQRAHIIYAIFKQVQEQVCLLVHNELEAQQIYQDLKFYLGDEVLFFPHRDIFFYDVEAISEEIKEERLGTLKELMEGRARVIVVPIEALLSKLTPVEIYKKYEITLKVGQIIDLQELIQTLVSQGYERMERVDSRGQFSVRGDILDVFPPSEENPLRIEFFDNEIDSLRCFEVDSQRSIEKIQAGKIYPAMEILIDPSLRQEGKDRIQEDLKNISAKLKAPMAKKLQEKLGEIIEKMDNLEDFQGIKTLAPYFYQRTSSLIDYLDSQAIIMLDEPDRIRERIGAYHEEFQENFKNLLQGGEVLPQQAHLLFNYEEILKGIKTHRLVVFSLLGKNYRDFSPMKTISIPSRSPQGFRGRIGQLINEVKDLGKDGYKIVLMTSTKEKAIRLLETFREEELASSFIVREEAEFNWQQLVILQGNLSRGFEYPDIKYIVMTDYEIYGIHKRKKKTSRRRDAAPIKYFIDLQVGDYVVHEGHGIGKYVGIEELKVEGIKKDYFKISYLGEDNLYVPTDQMDLIQKYIGAEDRAPRLNKLGGSEWLKTKARVKKAIEDMAEELLSLYAQREKIKGYGFSPDTDWQREFEYLFPFEETPDQLRAIEEIKEDMERKRPMDRLLCGDVGYGKTEVAIRAAFKAIMDSKQVAILVPTTILAQQHYNNFKERFAGFPVSIEMLSRFRTPSQQEKVIGDLRTGIVDIVIGTHRLLSKDVAFKDLGLLVVDEEQRFGVKHKEILKQMKKSVDVLTLTATPIPRTLHMSLVGIRDMSVIEDPPGERYPIQTYVAPLNESLIADAILKEIARGGQIYYVYNRVKGIHRIGARLKELVPQGRIAVAHGQMGERQLEKLMMEYYRGEHDILVCTTIIESGLDIPNVNTIIIQDADKLGLSQLYQLRGRVGRSNRQGYAYLLYEKDKILSEVAAKRLRAIKEFTEFGSGFKIAMRDLEIRGAGNLLGGEQHGHLASIGYDLYVKLLEESIRELKGQLVEEQVDTSIELNVDAYISQKYISNPNDKIEVYKKIASIRDKEDLYAIEEEVEDRFGNIPISARNLMLISYIKALAKDLGVESISQKSNNIIIQMTEGGKLKAENIVGLMDKYKRQITIDGGDRPSISYKIQGHNQHKILLDIKRIIEKISGLNKTTN